ncbi:MAG: peptide-methionine (S)-S-oxide reductase [Spartobacteria bacterium]|nr:peptide-methionine (S)-S-oxide reductase [Spartobacteria bacterium]
MKKRWMATGISGVIMLGLSACSEGTNMNSTAEKTAIENTPSANAYFAGGCFWGVEYYFEQKDGVLAAVSGYMGGTKDAPTYREVCAGDTGHLEAVRVTYNPQKVSFEELAMFFFEIHDPTQRNGQGPDIGPQYLSAVFYANEQEKETVLRLIHVLQEKGFDVATQTLPVSAFWEAEDYHQDYYDKHHKRPYCHRYIKRF